ncbi:hypothetical protein Godav_019548, partial [Gossypium davidsonii]|nr:hypothetical protein [Gossypium davidsonii]
TSISRAHSNKQGSFGLGLLSIPRSNLLISLEFYCHLKDFYRNKSTVAKVQPLPHFYRNSDGFYRYELKPLEFY